MATLHQFYATALDMETGLTAIERSMPLEYIRAGMFETEAVCRYPTATSIPNFGVSLRGGRACIEHDYIVVPAGGSVSVRKVSQRRGGTKYIINELQNPGIVFRPGGRFGENCLIAGEAGTPLTDEVSLRIWKLFAKYFFRDFVKIGLFQVGPDALRLLHAGYRLTPDAKWSREVDLNPAGIEKMEREYREKQANGN